MTNDQIVRALVLLEKVSLVVEDTAMFFSNDGLIGKRLQRIQSGLAEAETRLIDKIKVDDA